jgi:hypothetical protein
MIRKRFCPPLLAALAVTAFALPIEAHHPDDCCGGCEGQAVACAPPTRTVRVTEWVPEKYKATVTRYRTKWVEEKYTAHKTEWVEEKYTAHRIECVEEKYTAYRHEVVPVTRTRMVTCYRQVPVVEKREVTVCVPVHTTECRTVLKKVYSCRPVTTFKTKTIKGGHYECREVPCRESFLSRLAKLCHRKDCCEEECGPPPTKLVKVWVPECHKVTVPVTKMVRTCKLVPHTVRVRVCKMVPQKKTIQVRTCRCVPEKKKVTYTAHVCKTIPYQAVRKVARCVPYQATRKVAKCVPYQATRKVAKCVPYQATVVCTRLVPRTVCREVPCDLCAETHECCKSRGGLFSHFRGFGHHGHRDDCCH